MNKEQADMMEEINEQLRAMVTVYDSTLLAAAMSNTSAALWRSLLAAGKEKKESIEAIYGLLLSIATEPQEPPRIITKRDKETLQ